MASTKYKLGSLLRLCDERNTDSQYTLADVKGISIQKVFIETKADMTGVSLKPYILVKPDYFAYVTVTSRNGEKITIAHNDTESTYIVSSSYVVFEVVRTDILLSDYLFMYFNRPEFDRYARFNSWGSARETFSWEDMCDLDIALPSIEIQQKYVDIYNAMVANQRSYEQGLDDLKQAVFAEIDIIKHSAPKTPVGKLLEEIDCEELNANLMDILDDVDFLRKPFQLQDKDVLVLCSDGVSGVLTGEEILYCLQKTTSQEMCEEMERGILAANRAYQDNYTALVIQCIK